MRRSHERTGTALSWIRGATRLACQALLIALPAISAGARLAAASETREIVAGSLEKIAVGSAAHVWGIDAKGRPWLWAGSKWSKIEGQLSDISVGSDGEVLAIDTSSALLRWNGEEFAKVGGKLSRVAIGSAEHGWAIDAKGRVVKLARREHQVVAGKLREISVGSDGAVWGIGTDGICYRRDGDSWKAVEGKFEVISVGRADEVRAVDARGRLFRRTDERWKAAGDGMRSISVGGDGAAWGIDAEGRIVRFAPVSGPSGGETFAAAGGAGDDTGGDHLPPPPGGELPPPPGGGDDLPPPPGGDPLPPSPGQADEDPIDREARTIDLPIESRELTPGDEARFTPPSGSPELLIQRKNPDMTTDSWRLEISEFPRPGRRSTKGFIVPQLPEGQYRAIYLVDSTMVKSTTFSIRPELQIVGQLDAPVGDRVTIGVKMVGPLRSPPSTKIVGKRQTGALVSPLVRLLIEDTTIATPGSNDNLRKRTGADGIAYFTVTGSKHASTKLQARAAGFQRADATFRAWTTSPVTETIHPDGPEQAPVLYVHGFNDDGTGWARDTLYLAEQQHMPMSWKMTRYYGYGPDFSGAQYFTNNRIENYAVQWWASGATEIAPPHTTADTGYAFLSGKEALLDGTKWFQGTDLPHNRPVPGPLDLITTERWDVDLLAGFVALPIAALGEWALRQYVAWFVLDMTNNYNDSGRAHDKALDLLDLLERELGQGGSLSNYRQVNILTHSHGSQVVREMLDMAAAKNSRLTRECVANVIYNAPPFGGSPLAHIDALFYGSNQIPKSVFADPFLNKIAGSTPMTARQAAELILQRWTRWTGIRWEAIRQALPPEVMLALETLDDVEIGVEGVSWLATNPLGDVVASALTMVRGVVSHLTGLPGFPAAVDDLKPEAAAARLGRIRTHDDAKQFVVLGDGGLSILPFPGDPEEIAADPTIIAQASRCDRWENDDAVPVGSARLLTETDAFGPRMELLAEMPAFNHGDLLYGNVFQHGDLPGIGKVWLEAFLSAATACKIRGACTPVSGANRTYQVSVDSLFEFESEAAVRPEATARGVSFEYRAVRIDDGDTAPTPWYSLTRGGMVSFATLLERHPSLAYHDFMLEWRSINEKNGRETIRSARFRVTDLPHRFGIPSVAGIDPAFLLANREAVQRGQLRARKVPGRVLGATQILRTIGRNGREPDFVVQRTRGASVKVPLENVTNATFSWNGSPPASIPVGSGELDVPLDHLESGLHTLTVETIVSRLAPRVRREIQVLVDRDPPKLFIAGTGAQNRPVVGPKTLLWFDAVDELTGVGVGAMTVERNRVLPRQTFTFEQLRVAADERRSGTKGMEVRMPVEARDAVGNVAAQDLRVYYDWTPPNVSLLGIEGAERTSAGWRLATDKAKLRVAARDEVCDVSRVTAHVFGEDAILVGIAELSRKPDGSFSSRVGVARGSNRVVITARDGVGNSASIVEHIERTR